MSRSRATRPLMRYSLCPERYSRRPTTTSPGFKFIAGFSAARFFFRKAGSLEVSSSLAGFRISSVFSVPFVPPSCLCGELFSVVEFAEDAVELVGGLAEHFQQGRVEVARRPLGDRPEVDSDDRRAMSPLRSNEYLSFRVHLGVICHLSISFKDL